MDQWPADLVAVPPYLQAAETTMMSDRPAEREMLEKTAWPELVNVLYYYQPIQIIRTERTDVTIVELAPLEDLPYAWPSDYTRVCVKVDSRTMHDGVCMVVTRSTRFHNVAS